MCWRRIILLILVVIDRGTSQNCNHDGELLENTDNCRKYYKCAQGLPSPQSCPGSLVFDTGLKICNWPDNTPCLSDLLASIKKPSTLEKSGGLTEDELFKADDIVEPELTEEEEKKRKAAIASLFHVRDRKKSPLSNCRNRPRTRPRNSLTTTTLAPPTTTRSFASRGSQINNLRSQERPNTIRPRERPAVRDRDRNSNRERTQDRTRNEDRNSSKNDDKDEEELSDKEAERQKLKEEILRELFGDEQYESGNIPTLKPKPKTTSKPKPTFPVVKCHSGSSTELYPNPQNCRKYYKCEAGGPSLQSCPANLIFDMALKICNWPDATDCIEDPNAPLPETSSSDRHPAKVRRPPPTFNAVDSNIREPSTPSSQRPRPDFEVSANKGGPSYREALDREDLLTSEYPLFKEVKRTVRTLETSLVEKIEAKKKDNPDNVKRVEFILSEDNYEDLFPRRHETYTYKRLLQAIGKFPAVCGYVGTEDKSDKICRKTLATMFAHFTQETGNHNPSDKEFEEWRQGLSQVRESGCTETSPGCGYNLNCEDKDSITKKWACGKDQKGSWKKYFGRGAKQLSYNFNYGQFSQAMFGDGRLLLDFPDFVATTWLNLASATWFYTTPQPPKPSMLHVIDGTWVPNSEDRRNGIEPGFGATINIINGGLECNTKDGRESRAALNRIAYYKQFAWYLYVDYEDETLGCAKQQQFTAGGAGAIPIYWDKDWSFPFSCRLVPYQTAFSALAPGEYVDCIEENFNLKIDRS